MTQATIDQETQPGSPSSAGPARLRLRPASGEEASGLHELISRNVETGHLLRRDLLELEVHAPRFLVASDGTSIVACAELATLSSTVAEVRSLVVHEQHRGLGLGTRLVQGLMHRARIERYRVLCALTHEPKYFVNLGFSIVPHVWLPAKIARDCHSCEWFRRCDKWAMTLDLETRPARRGAAAGAADVTGATVPWREP